VNLLFDLGNGGGGGEGGGGGRFIDYLSDPLTHKVRLCCMDLL
jgi:hypothetical protein